MINPIDNKTPQTIEKLVDDFGNSMNVITHALGIPKNVLVTACTYGEFDEEEQRRRLLEQRQKKIDKIWKKQKN